MKQEKDITKARDIIAQVDSPPPIPATTPEMIAHYRRHLQLNHSDKELLVGAGFAMLGPWDRLRWVRTNLYEGGRPEETLTAEIDLWGYDLNWTERLKAFLCWISEVLDKDHKHFRYAVCCEGGEDTAFYLLHYRGREIKAFPADKGQPILYLANVLNNILQPNYELRRFTDPKLGKDGILMPMTSGDWEALTNTYGPRAIEARFSSIYTPAVNPIRP